MIGDERLAVAFGIWHLVCLGLFGVFESVYKVQRESVCEREREAWYCIVPYIR